MSSSQQPSPVQPLIEAFKLRIRREQSPGHLPICWALLTAALGLPLCTYLFYALSNLQVRSQSLHLFLNARGLLSAAVRLNTIGPYASQQYLLHVVRPIVDTVTAKCAHLRTEYRSSPNNGPCTTWPLGEILAARHDLQHSRIFNS